MIQRVHVTCGRRARRDQDKPFGRVAGSDAAVLCDQQADVVDAVGVEVGSDRSLDWAGKAKIDRFLNGGGQAAVESEQVEAEYAVLPDAQVVVAVAVKVADDWHAVFQRAGELEVGDFDVVTGIAIEIPLGTREQPNLVAGVSRNEIAGHRNTVHVHAAGDGVVGHAIVIEIEQPAASAADIAIGAKLVEAGGGRSTGGGEIAGKEHIALGAKRKHDVAVDAVVADALGIKNRVAIDVDVDAASTISADLGPAVDVEAGDEVAARVAFAAGKLRRFVRLSGVVLTVEGVARNIDDRAGKRQRIAVIRQRRGKL